MPYISLKDRRKDISGEMTKYWIPQYRPLLSGMLESMKVLRDEVGICTDRDTALRTSENRRAFHRAIEILEIITSEDFEDTYKYLEEQDKLYNELWGILRVDLRTWWN